MRDRRLNFVEFADHKFTKWREKLGHQYGLQHSNFMETIILSTKRNQSFRSKIAQSIVSDEFGESPNVDL
jgi:hypothetical protein